MPHNSPANSASPIVAAVSAPNAANVGVRRPHRSAACPAMIWATEATIMLLVEYSATTVLLPACALISKGMSKLAMPQ